MAFDATFKRIRLSGDQERAASHRGRALVLLDRCRTIANMAGLDVYLLKERLQDGTTITAKFVGVADYAIIESPFIDNKKKKEKPNLFDAAIVVYVGNEEIGYTVARFSFYGDLVDVVEFKTSAEMFLAYKEVRQKEKYIRRNSLTGSNPELVGINRTPGVIQDLCDPAGASCALIELGPTVACEYFTGTENTLFEKPHQLSVMRHNHRAWCNSRPGDRESFVTRHRTWTESIKNAFSIPGQGVRRCMATFDTTDDDPVFSNDAVSIHTKTTRDWLRCLGSTDNGYWYLNSPIAFSQAIFVMPETPIGRAFFDKSRTAAGYIAGFLDGSAKMRDDTGEPFVELWDNDVIYSFLDEKNFDHIYAFSYPPVSNLKISSFTAVVAFALREDGVPNLAANTGSFNICTSKIMNGWSFDIYMQSFNEVDMFYEQDSGYLVSDVRQRIFGRCKLTSPGFGDTEAEIYGKALFESISVFLKQVGATHKEKGLMPENVRPMRGNIGAYASTLLEDVGLEEGMARKAMFLVNAIRKEYGLTILSPDGDLSYLAEIHAVDCATHDIEGHESSYGGEVGERAAQTLYGTRTFQDGGLGENVAWGYQTAEATVQGWMNSPIHRANILEESWRDSAICVRFSEEGQPYWVQVFGFQDR